MSATKHWGEESWREFYADPQNFARLFDDYETLKSQEERFDLSSSQEMQKTVIEELIEAKLGL